MKSLLVPTLEGKVRGDRTVEPPRTPDYLAMMPPITPTEPLPRIVTGEAVTVVMLVRAPFTVEPVTAVPPIDAEDPFPTMLMGEAVAVVMSVTAPLIFAF